MQERNTTLPPPRRTSRHGAKQNRSTAPSNTKGAALPWRHRPTTSVVVFQGSAAHSQSFIARSAPVSERHLAISLDRRSGASQRTKDLSRRPAPAIAFVLQAFGAVSNDTSTMVAPTICQSPSWTDARRTEALRSHSPWGANASRPASLARHEAE